MRKKSLVFLALAAISLSACSYNPFNEFTGINFYFISRLNVFQSLDYIFWDKNENCAGYELYLYDEEITSSSKTSSTSSTDKSSEKPVLTTVENTVKIESEWIGKKIKVVGFTYDTSKGILNAVKTNLVSSKKLTITEMSVPSSTSAKLTIDNAYLKEQFRSRDYGAIRIPNTVSYLNIVNVTNAYHPTFIFEKRDDGSDVRIDLNQSDLTAIDDLFGPSIFKYDGINTDLDFYFNIIGRNFITAADLGNSDGAAIDLPRVTFYNYADIENEQTVLSVHGGSTTNSVYNSGYAIKAKRIVNHLPEPLIKFYGGDGGPGSTQYGDGGTGQIPIISSCKVFTSIKNSIGLKSGNGGVGGSSGVGGNAYTYNYLINKPYKKYADAFFCINEATVGKGGKSPGKLIDYQETKTSSSSKK